MALNTQEASIKHIQKNLDGQALFSKNWFKLAVFRWKPQTNHHKT